MAKVEEFLSHHGIRDMRWGIRRYQYKNGTLTPEGKLRYRKHGEDEKNSEDYDSKTKSYKEKDARKLESKELKERTERLNAENNYRNALKANKALDEDSSSAKKKALKKIFIESATSAASTVMTTVYKQAALNFIDRIAPSLEVKKSK